MTDISKHDQQFLAQFEPDVFWQQHGKKITWAIVAILAIGLIAAWRQRQATEHEESGAARLTQAMDENSLRQLSQEFGSSPVGAQALLRLADMQFAGGRPADAAATYQQFLSGFPAHALVDSAKLGQAAALEAQGNFEGAKTQYLQIASSINSYTAVAAKIGAARCAEALGQTKEARQRYEDVLPAVMKTPWETTIAIRLAVLARSQAPEQASPTSQLPDTKTLILPTSGGQ